jgi:signal transduction histidine kinase
MIDLSNRIYQESHRMSDLVMDMLKLSEIESQKSIQSKEMIHINQMVDDILNNLGVLIKNQEMTINKDISVKYIEFNPDDFYHMVKNILENAIKYSPKASQVWIRIYKKNERLNIEIKDEGIGIPKADQDRIFERFYRVDKARSRISGGTGLGLSIVKHIVLNAGGHIFVESEENVGTTIHIELKEMTQSPQ